MLNRLTCRRNSGGGCVYHDLGNLNLSFLTSKAEYNRRRNLELVCAGVRRAVRGDLGVEINSRDDIVVAGDRNSAAKSSIRRFVITEKAPTRAFSWLKAATTAFTFKTLLRH